MFNKTASAVAAALLASAANATITITAVAVAGSGQTSISTPGQPAESVFAGLVTLTSGITHYLGFCVDIAHNISTGTGQALGYDLHPLSTDFSGETLTSTQIDRIFALAALGRANTTSARDTGAIQQAIWTIEHPPPTFTAINTADGFDQSRVQYFIDLAPTLHADGQVLQSQDGHQSFAGADAVPEPATWAMMIAGFGMVGLAARYRRHTPVRVSASGYICLRRSIVIKEKLS